MSAGRGILHSEYNPSADTPVHLLQIWIEPATRGLAPSYEQKRFEPDELQGRLRLVASPLGRDGSVTLHQDTEIYAARLDAGEGVAHVLAPGQLAYLQVARGALTLNGLRMQAGDGAKVRAEGQQDIVGVAAAELLLFDVMQPQGATS
jgi:redox-sensitive bicupin YhaK (pirin superfamily)